MFSALHYLFLISSVTSSVLAATQCYQCSTATAPECRDLVQTNNLQKCKTTTDNEINCVTYSYMLNQREITYRGCRQKGDTCEDVKNALTMEKKEFVSCKLCDTDFCSKASKAGEMIFLVILLTTIIFIG